MLLYSTDCLKRNSKMKNKEQHTFPFIERLLDGAEVEWKPLGEVFALVTDFTAAGSFASNAANVQYKQEKSFAQLVRTTDLKSRFKNKDKFIYVDEHAFEYLWRVNLNEECLVLSNVGNCGEIYHIMPDTLPYTNNVLGPNALLLRTTIGMNRFFYYWFLSNRFQCDLGKITSKTGQTKFNKTNLKKIIIPLPPLSVQKEIVRILDKFTELEAELEGRKRQYEYYRNQLLSFDILNKEEQLVKNVSLIPLGSIGDICMCKRILKQQTSDKGDIPFYKIGTFGKVPNSFISKELFYKYKEKYNYPLMGDVLISASGTIGRAVIFDGKDAYFQDSNIVWIKNDESKVLNKYLYYYYQIAKWNVAEGGTIQRLYNDNLRKTLIPIPYSDDKQKSLSEQQRIVSILDKFDTLTTSISEGLPKEIELRRKQYEYYRDRLLSFKH